MVAAVVVDWVVRVWGLVWCVWGDDMGAELCWSGRGALRGLLELVLWGVMIAVRVAAEMGKDGDVGGVVVARDVLESLIGDGSR